MLKTVFLIYNILYLLDAKIDFIECKFNQIGKKATRTGVEFKALNNGMVYFNKSQLK